MSTTAPSAATPSTSSISNALLPIYSGITLWPGLHLRDPRLRALIPIWS
jgi:hypothetical protein